MSTRCCSRNSCREPAVATLTYVYATSTAVVGPLAITAEPHAYDLCRTHACRLTIPRGWELVRHDGELGPPAATPDDLLALAEAVREPVHRSPRSSAEVTSLTPAPRGAPGPQAPAGSQVPAGPRARPRPRPYPDGRRGHLRVVDPPG